MIAPAKRDNPILVKARSLFEQMLPQIQRMAFGAFREKAPELREELAAEVVARAYCAFVRLVGQGRADIGYATPLAMFAVKQVKSGRRFGTKLNVRDISSEYAQMTKKITIQRLDRYDNQADMWRSVLVEDRHAGPAEIAATRIDFAAWLRSLSSRQRRMAMFLACGETTGAAARRFRVSPSRVSQIRKYLRKTWETFVGETPAVRSQSVS